MVKDLR